ncbi:MAG: HU family DNA-binding protein [Bacilli bacterium]|nr:HU family DNA-binding protein [Bacilli bacterium]
MNKAELIVAVGEKAGFAKKEAELLVNAVFEEMEKCLVKGEEVKISGFGIFNKKERAARKGTNPSTQEEIVIPAASTVTFKPSKNLKEKLG